MIDLHDAPPFRERPGSDHAQGPIPVHLDMLHAAMARPLIAVHVARWLPPGITIVHLALTLVMLVWSYSLAVPEDTFSSSRMYSMFQLTWPYTEAGWSVVFLVPGLIGLGGLFVPRRRRMLRLHLAGLLMLAHVILTLMTRAGNPAGTAWRIYALVFVPLAVWRVLAEAYIEWIDT